MASRMRAPHPSGQGSDSESTNAQPLWFAQFDGGHCHVARQLGHCRVATPPPVSKIARRPTDFRVARGCWPTRHTPRFAPDCSTKSRRRPPRPLPVLPQPTVFLPAAVVWPWIQPVARPDFVQQSLPLENFLQMRQAQKETRVPR